MATEKLTTRLKNKTWTNPQINNLKNSQELKMNQTTDTTQKTRKHILTILNIINVSCNENYEFSWVQVS
jgi:hypothetical protein